MSDDDKITPEHHIRLEELLKYKSGKMLKPDIDDDKITPANLVNLDDNPAFQQRRIDPDDARVRPEQISNLREQPEWQQRRIDPDDLNTRKDEIPEFINSPAFQRNHGMKSDPNDERFTETVFQRQVRLRAERDGISREEAERLIKEETAARFRGEYSPSNKAAPENASQIASKTDAVAFFDKDHFKTYLRGRFKIVRENPDGTMDIMDKKDFISGNYEHRILVVPPEGGDPKSTLITELWLKSDDARKFPYGFDFDVSAPGNRGGKYNLFKGWKLGKGIAGDVSPFLGLMKDVISSGNDRDFTILEALIAQMFQEPDKKPGKIIVIRGDEGVGKSFFIQHLSELAAPYSFKTSNPEHIFGDHNGQLKHVLLLHLEEAVWPGGNKAASFLKDMIDSPTIPINDKFVPVYTVPNYLHLFVTGNPEWLIAAGPKARRLFALHASEAQLRDSDYFSALDRWFHNGGDAALLHHFLNLDFKTSLAKFGIKDLWNLPVTREHIEQQKQSMSGVREWSQNWVELGEWPYGRVVDGHCLVIKSLLCHDYNKSPAGQRHPLTERQFGIQFLALFPLVITGKKQYSANGRIKSVIGVDCQEYNSENKQRDAYDIPPIAELRQVLDFNFGGDGCWEEKGEWTIRHGSNRINLDDKQAF